MPPSTSASGPLVWPVYRYAPTARLSLWAGVLAVAALYGWGAWQRAGNQVPAGRLLVRAGPITYGFGRTPYDKHGSHVGLGGTHYRLFAAGGKAPAAEKPAAGPAGAEGQPRGWINLFGMNSGRPQ